MPDVLGISQDALYPDVTCKKTQNETAEPCEHQLDQLVVSVLYLKCSMSESKNYPYLKLYLSCNLCKMSQSASL